jgi:CubicO group peptidase (beta-lactamase class C family)
VEKIKKYIESLNEQPQNINFDRLSFALIDFARQESHFIHLNAQSEKCIYDLASLAKPLLLGFYFLKNSQELGPEYKLLLNHQGGCAAHEILDKKNWREKLLNFSVKDSPTVYSDLGYLSLMLKIEREKGRTLKDLVNEVFTQGLVFWKDLKKPQQCAMTGWRNQKPIQGQIHDENAFQLDSFVPHTGLFGSLESLSATLLWMDEKYDLLAHQKKHLLAANSGQRFINGWDRVQDVSLTLAGANASLMTFGHLGFTGTSIWINPEKKCGYVLLTNATQNDANNKQSDKTIINKIRRELGGLYWSFIFEHGPDTAIIKS